MAEVISDIVEDASVRRTADGLEATRGFIVRGLEGDASLRAASALNQADIPTHGSPHPTIPLIRVFSTDVKAIDNNTVRVIINYKQLQGGGTSTG